MILISCVVGGKCGYVWGVIGLFCFVVVFFCLFEMKGWFYCEIDFLFKCYMLVCKFVIMEIGVEDDE